MQEDWGKCTKYQLEELVKGHVIEPFYATIHSLLVQLLFMQFDTDSKGEENRDQS